MVPNTDKIENELLYRIGQLTRFNITDYVESKIEELQEQYGRSLKKKKVSIRGGKSTGLSQM